MQQGTRNGLLTVHPAATCCRIKLLHVGGLLGEIMPALCSRQHITATSLEIYTRTLGSRQPLIDLPGLAGLPLAELRMGQGVLPTGHEGRPHLAGLASLATCLRSLRIQGVSFPGDSAALAALSSLTLLHLQHLCDCIPATLCTALAGLRSLICEWLCFYDGQLLPDEATTLSSLTALQMAAPCISEAPAVAFQLPLLSKLSLAAYQGAAPPLPPGLHLSRLELLGVLGCYSTTVPAALADAPRLRKLRLFLPAKLPEPDFELLAGSLPALQQLLVACREPERARAAWCERLLRRRPHLGLFLEKVSRS